MSIVAKFARRVVSYAGTVAAAVSSGGSLRIWVSTVRIDRILIAPNIIEQSLARLDGPSQKARRQLQGSVSFVAAPPTKLDVKRQTFDTFFWARTFTEMPTRAMKFSWDSCSRWRVLPPRRSWNETFAVVSRLILTIATSTKWTDSNPRDTVTNGAVSSGKG